MIAELLGVDNDPRFSGWDTTSSPATRIRVTPTSTCKRTAGTATVELTAFLAEKLIEHRRLEPGDDVLTHLVRAEEAGDRLSTNELIVLCMTLLVAGFVTTVNLIGNAVLTFIDHPEDPARVRRDPVLLPSTRSTRSCATTGEWWRRPGSRAKPSSSVATGSNVGNR